MSREPKWWAVAGLVAGVALMSACKAQQVGVLADVPSTRNIAITVQVETGDITVVPLQADICFDKDAGGLEGGKCAKEATNKNKYSWLVDWVVEFKSEKGYCSKDRECWVAVIQKNFGDKNGHIYPAQSLKAGNNPQGKPTKPVTTTGTDPFVYGLQARCSSKEAWCTSKGGLLGSYDPDIMPHGPGG